MAYGFGSICIRTVDKYIYADLDIKIENEVENNWLHSTLNACLNCVQKCERNEQ